MKRKLNNILIVLLTGVFLFSCGKILVTLIGQYREDHAFQMLIEDLEAAYAADGNGETQAGGADQNKGSVSKEEDQSGEDIDTKENRKAKLKLRDAMQRDDETGMLVPYQSLYEKNPDLYGWITIEGTKVNYPVMYTPQDPEYYLRRAFDGTETESGTPFLDSACSEEGNLYVIYGHRMKNRTMFGSLPFYEKKKYWEEHPYIYFDTLYEQGTYEVVAAFYSKIYEDGEKGFRYYNYKDLSDEEVFAAFREGVEESAMYETDEVLEYGDQVLLLSTCSYHTEEGRFVVVAKKLYEKGEINEKSSDNRSRSGGNYGRIGIVEKIR